VSRRRYDRRRAASDVLPEERYRPDDGCPLFSTRLEDHLVAVSRGEEPKRGRFCGNCYTPLTRNDDVCPHCGNDATTGRRAALVVPDEIALILRTQRNVESTWVNGMAYLGLFIAVVGGIAIVLAIPFFRAHLIWATAVYGVLLLVGGRMLAGFLGGFFGDRWGYAIARRRTRAGWAHWLRVRDQRSGRAEG
jgi:hypothetical protein